MELALSQGIRTLSVGMFFVLAVGGAQAIPLHYSESVSGDLSPFPTSAFDFDIGNNTITGTSHLSSFFEGGPHFDPDFDSFAFRLPDGLRLVAISVAFRTTTSNATIANSELYLCVDIGCGTGYLGIATVDWLGGSPVNVDFGALPLGAGTYALQTSGLGIGAPLHDGGGMAWTADYRWTMRVIPLPEPGVLPLLWIGLGGLLVLRRRQSADFRQ